MVQMHCPSSEGGSVSELPGSNSKSGDNFTVTTKFYFPFLSIAQVELPKVKLLFAERTAPPYCAKLFQNCVVPNKIMELDTTWIAAPSGFVQFSEVDSGLVAAELCSKHFCH